MTKDIMPTLEVWTPEIARDWLTRPAAGQRSLSMVNVTLYRRRMEQGNWTPGAHAPICIMENGTLGNGNHRANALSLLPNGTEVKMLVTRNVPMDALPDMDTARPRSLAHAFGYEFHDRAEGNLKEIASLTGVLLASPPGDLPRVDRKPDPVDAVEFASAHFEKLHAVTTLAKSVARRDGKQVGSVATAKTLGWLLWQTWEHPETEQFWNTYATRKYGGGDPRGDLHAFYSKRLNAFAPGAMSRQVTLQRMADLTGVWNAYRADSPKHKWRPWDGQRDTFPQPTK